MAKKAKTPDDILEEATKLRDQMIAEGGNSAAMAKYLPLIHAKMHEAALSYPEIDEDNILGALFLVGSEERWELFEQMCDKYDLSPKAFALGLKEAWSTGVATGNPNAYRFFRQVDGRLMMDEEEQQFFDALPDVVTIYRGCHINELNYFDEDPRDESCPGISWTTDRGVAEFFAFRYETEYRVVVSLVVKKSSIVTFINERNEYECIFLDVLSDEPTIVTQEPTAYYEEFMEKKDNQ